MAMSIPLDTDVLVDFFRGHSKAVAFVNAHSARIILSSIDVAELYAGVKGDAEQSTLENFVSLFRVVPSHRPGAALSKTGFRRSLSAELTSMPRGSSLLIRRILSRRRLSSACVYVNDINHQPGSHTGDLHPTSFGLDLRTERFTPMPGVHKTLHSVKFPAALQICL